MPRRTALGLDPNRVSLLVAILEKRGGFRLFDQDVYVNIAGGLRVTETAIDLGVAAALISSYTGRAVPSGTVFFGEMGLGGEVRSVPKAGIRLKEAERIGLKRAYVPRKVAKELNDLKGLELISIEHVQELADKL
jgi:DNA repair protein RadA/Sms